MAESNVKMAGVFVDINVIDENEFFTRISHIFQICYIPMEAKQNSSEN